MTGRAPDIPARADPTRPYTVESLAARWGVSAPTVYAMIKRGEIKAFRAGRTPLRIAAAEVERHECGSSSIADPGTPSGAKAEKPSDGLSGLRIVR